MSDFQQTMANAPVLSEAKQKQAGKAVAGAMPGEYTEFCKQLVDLVATRSINLDRPESLLKMDVYHKLTELDRSKVDFAVTNIANSLRHIHDFYKSKQTPDSSPQLQNMIDHLWDMKKRLETAEHVFKF